jgi:hypothetical protein
MRSEANMTARTFRASIRNFEKLTEDKLDAIARQTSLEMASRVVTSTPVDTGFLRGSWQPSIGEPAGAKAGVTDKSGAAAMAQVALVITQMKAGDRFYMINNTSYALYVERGTSKFAGRFYVADNVKQWPVVVSAVMKDLKLQ